jgi:2-methylisocitrate lyase-like PEP mutase family enzyme
VSQNDLAARFRALNQGPRAFVIANPWDAGSARVRASLGFPALARLDARPTQNRKISSTW